MQPFGNWLMRKPSNALLAGFIASFLPFFGWLASVVMALVTLRKGAKSGAQVLLVILVAPIVFALIRHQYIFLYNALAGTLLVFLLANVLRNASHWAMVLIISAILGVLIILALHGYFDGLNAWWEQKMLMYIQSLGQTAHADLQTQKTMVAQLSKFATGLQIGVVMIANLSFLLIARHWQSLLYNPGKLQPELQSIRMPIWYSALVMAVLLIGFFSGQVFIIDMMPVILIPMLAGGLSCVHFWVKQRKLSMFLLVVMYLGLIMLFPYFCLILVLLATLDSFINIRARIAPKT